MKKIGFIGAGNMATAIMSGMLKSGNYKAEQLYITDVNDNKLQALQAELSINICKNSVEVCKAVDALILAVKPNAYPAVIEEIKEKTTNILIISIAAGLTLDYLESAFLEGQRVVRTMPNLPAKALAGATSLVKGKYASIGDLDVTKAIFDSIGQSFIIDEKYINAATALAGSSPAMVAMMIEAMADAAVLNGMPRNLAYEFAIQGVLGSSKLFAESREHVAEWKDRVASPAGTTIAMIASLENDNFRSSVIKAIDSCIKKADNI